MIRFKHAKVLMDDHGKLLKNELAIVRYGGPEELTGHRIIELDRRGIRTQALDEGEEFVLEETIFEFADGEGGSIDFNHVIVPIPGSPATFTGETKRMLFSLDIWDSPGGHRFFAQNECEVWVVPTPPQLRVDVKGGL